MKLIPFVVGAVLLEIGLIVFIQEIPSSSNGTPPAGSAYAPTLSIIFFLGLLLLAYGVEGKKTRASVSSS